MLIALTLLNNHFDAALLKPQPKRWQILDQCFLKTTSLSQLHKKWRRQTPRVAVGISRAHCHAHQFQIQTTVTATDLRKYILLNSKRFFHYPAKELIFDYARRNLNHQHDQVQCIATTKSFIHQVHRQFKKAQLQICLIDSSVNALLRAFLHQHKTLSQQHAIWEKHPDGSSTQTHPADKPHQNIEKIYCINNTEPVHDNTETLSHGPCALSTYGLALNAHVN